MLIFEPTRTYGEEFLICFNGESKYGYIQAVEDSNMKLVESDGSTTYEYVPPVPGSWTNLKSDQEIERDWVTDARPKIRLQIRRVIPREDKPIKFENRDVDDVQDGYVACESQHDPRTFKTIESMEHPMQAVPVLVDSSSQTELKHPKNIHTQYEPRVFSEEDVEVIAKSEEMTRFLRKVVDV